MQTALIFVGIPIAAFLVIAAVIYGATAQRARRYRLGRPFDFTPVWLLAGDQPAEPTRQLTARSQAQAAAKGGARGSW